MQPPEITPVCAIYLRMYVSIVYSLCYVSHNGRVLRLLDEHPGLLSASLRPSAIFLTDALTVLLCAKHC